MVDLPAAPGTATPALAARSPLAGLVTGRRGRPDGAPGAVLEERMGVQVASLAARRGRDAALAEAVRTHWGLELPATPRWTGDARMAALWSGPGQWLVLTEGWDGDLEAALRAGLGPLASVADQGDGRVVLRLRGPRARDVLAKVTAIDLHPRAFAPGDTALTLLAHIAVQLRQVDAAPEYEILAFRGYAGSLHAALVAAGEEYGIEVAPARG